ncbi:alpha/beta hydrolase [Eubacterium oxidoreducens]|uniref:Acetyl esterase/lipase n=1 Tax=Eubacterium oxidoreducens TaxID=1732 RepID=A0A1G6AJY6_EUBOX|nr:alpha/beta hydrolase [Eubacterium oxidoreducens]SDB08731.1 Acetyl esterase/lipase [Eubacterium oxidoreducens]
MELTLRLVLFCICWGVVSVVLIAIAYGFFVSFYRRLMMGIVAAVALVVHLIGYWNLYLTGFWHNLFHLIMLIVMGVIVLSDAEGITKPPFLDWKTASVRAGLMALSTLGSTRRVYRSFFKHGKYDKHGRRISKIKIPEGYTHYTTVFRGSNIEFLMPQHEKHRVVLMIPGGGYVGRMTDLKMNYSWYYSEAANDARVVILDYKTVLDGAEFPEPLDEAVRLYKWILEQGYEGKDIIVAGDSAGGNLALTLIEYLLDHEIEVPKCVITFSAWTDMSGSSSSYRRMKRYDALFGGNHVIEMSAHKYVESSGKSLKDRYVSPYFVKDFKGFPPMLMQVGSYEMLLDSSVDFAERAIKCGADANLEIYEGMFHEFQRTRNYNEYAKAAWWSVKAFLQHIYGDEY